MRLPADSVFALGAFSPGGSNVVLVSNREREGAAQVWDWVAGIQVMSLDKRAGMILSAAYSPDGSRIVTTAADQTIFVWDAATGRLVTGPIRHPGSVFGAAFRPDGQAFVTWTPEHRARVWATETGEALLPPLGHAAGIGFACFSANGGLIATASSDRSARVWDATTGERISVPMEHGRTVRRVYFHPHDKSVLTMSYDGAARLWTLTAMDGTLGEMTRLTEFLSGYALDATFSLTSLSSDQIVSSYEGFRASHPDYFLTTPEQRQAWHRIESAEAELHKRWSTAIWHLGALIKDSPNAADLHQRRAIAAAESQRWEQAHGDYVRAADLGYEDYDGLLFSALKVGDNAGARRAAERIVYEAVEKAESREHAAFMSAIAPGLLDDYAVTVRFAEEETEKTPEGVEAQANLAMQYLRAGRPTDAVRVLESPVLASLLASASDRVSPEEPSSNPLLFLAAAVVRATSGDLDEAGELLDRAAVREDAAKTALASGWTIDWEQQVVSDILRKEAEEILARRAATSNRDGDSI